MRPKIKKSGRAFSSDNGNFIQLLFVALGVLVIVMEIKKSLDFTFDPLNSTSKMEEAIVPLSSASASTSLSAWDPKMNPLGIPPGKAQPLPPPRLDNSAVVDKQRNKYGGKGDEQHLGGFGEIDPGGISPGLFKHMIQEWGVQSFMDIGCGRGFSTTWFHFHGCDVICAEGSHDAFERSLLPDKEHQVMVHDFSRGPWWPEKTYDVAWSVEFLEHVNVNYHYNYVTAFRKAAIICVTASKGGGWHHVEIHKNEWWIRKYESYGFRYDAELTEEARKVARENKKTYRGPNDVYLDGFYVRVTLMVFVNPVVAALPEHAHLFPELGCGIVGSKRKCNLPLESEADPKMYPLELTEEQDQAWLDWISARVNQSF